MEVKVSVLFCGCMVETGPVVCFKVVWLKKVKLWKFPGCLLVGLYNFILVVAMSPEYGSRKCELRPVTEERTKTGKWIKSRLMNQT